LGGRAGSAKRLRGAPGKILPAQSGARRAGFTLVEVIVVLVILAILAAIAIPALTGYIDKAQDKQYIMQARDADIAIRSAIDDFYAEGKLAPYESYIQTGRTSQTYVNIKLWAPAFDDGYYDIYKEAAKLIGTSWDIANIAEPGYWTINPVGDKNSTLLDAGGFLYYFYPDGDVDYSGNPVIFVTYRISELELREPQVSGRTQAAQFQLDFRDCAEYDPTAGYYVYHTTK
jgi:prepilin-type N-terminal cleavage/methylation domain-containing protein